MLEFLRGLKSFLLSILRCQYGWTSEMTVTGVSEIDAAIPEYWAIGAIHDGNRESFWGGLAGKEGSRMPVVDKTGPLRKSGDQITFTVIEQLMGTGVTGENVLKGNEEKLGISTFTVSADIVRNAVAVSRKSTKQANFQEVQTARTLLKDWFSRKFDGDIFTTITGDSDVETLYAGTSNTSEANLNASDGDRFGPSEIMMMRMALIRQGAMPLKIQKINGRSVPIYGLVYGEIEDYWLNQNTTFVQAVREAWTRFKEGGGNHPLFNGAVGIYRNMVLYPYYSLLPIPQGTALRPETTLSATLTTAETDTINVGVAGNTRTTSNYTIYFASSGSLQIDDEILSYTGKTITTFTGLSRGVSSTTAAQHSAGALITQRDIATVIGFGAQAVFRAMPESAEPIGDKDDYGEQIGLGIRAYYGHACRKDALRGKACNLVQMKVLSDNPGTV